LSEHELGLQERVGIEMGERLAEERLRLLVR
jgi:hypothetical protein